MQPVPLHCPWHTVTCAGDAGACLATMNATDRIRQIRKHAQQGACWEVVGETGRTKHRKCLICGIVCIGASGAEEHNADYHASLQQKVHHILHSK